MTPIVSPIALMQRFLHHPNQLYHLAQSSAGQQCDQHRDGLAVGNDVGLYNRRQTITYPDRWVANPGTIAVRLRLR